MIVKDLVCLLPVRNGEPFLHQYFESVRAFCDQIMALDDGSIDNTSELLRAEPMVKAILENSPRPTYAGWDDAANRARLLDACSGRSPKWILWLDADETIPGEDAVRLAA